MDRTPAKFRLVSPQNPLLSRLAPKGNWIYKLKTIHGTRHLDTGTLNHADAMRIIDESYAEEIRHAAEVINFNQKMMQQVCTGRSKVTMGEVTVEFRDWYAERVGARVCTNIVGLVMQWMNQEKLIDLRPWDVEMGNINAFVNPISEIKYSTRVDRLKAIRAFYRYASIVYPVNDIGSLARVDHRKCTQAQRTVAVKNIFSTEDFATLIEYMEAHYAKLLVQKQRAAEQFAAGGEFSRNREEEFTLMIEKTLLFLVGSVISRHMGLRMGDIVTLEWATLDQSLNKTFTLFTRKSGVKIEQEVPQIVRDYIRLLVQEIGQPFLFPRMRQRYIQDDFARPNVTGGFKQIVDRAGLGGRGYSFHCLRHTFATEMEQKYGVERTMEMMGHANEGTTEIYVHRDQREALAG